MARMCPDLSLLFTSPPLDLVQAQGRCQRDKLKSILWHTEQQWGPVHSQSLRCTVLTLKEGPEAARFPGKQFTRECVPFPTLEPMSLPTHKPWRNQSTKLSPHRCTHTPTTAGTFRFSLPFRPRHVLKICKWRMRRQYFPFS